MVSHYLRLIKSLLVTPYQLFFKLRSVDEDLRRREFVLNVLLGGSIVLLLWSNSLLFVAHLNQRNPENLISLGGFTALTLSFISLYILSRLGKITLASYALITLYFLAVLYGTTRWGVTVPSLLLSYALLITITAILISSRAGLYMTMVITLGILIFGYREVSQNQMPLWRQELVSFFDIIEYSFVLLIIALVSWLSSKEIEKSLKRARKSEKELRAERDSLEITIAERTEELHRTQAEKVSQLYRFAEFGRLSSGLFHDVVNPLTAISCNISNIQNSFHPELPLVKENLERALTASQRMENLISTANQQMRDDTEEEIFNINQVIMKTLTLFAYRSKKESIVVIANIPHFLGLLGNPSKFQQIITNLCSNAFDSYQNVNTQQKEIIIQAEQSQQNIIISITDYGSGIKPEIISQIFNPFFSTKSASAGMGLGLAMVKSIITNHFKGEIRVESNKTTGTVFTITLPSST